MDRDRVIVWVRPCKRSSVVLMAVAPREVVVSRDRPYVEATGLCGFYGSPQVARSSSFSHFSYDTRFSSYLPIASLLSSHPRQNAPATAWFLHISTWDVLPMICTSISLDILSASQPTISLLSFFFLSRHRASLTSLCSRCGPFYTPNRPLMYTSLQRFLALVVTIHLERSQEDMPTIPSHNFKLSSESSNDVLQTIGRRKPRSRAWRVETTTRGTTCCNEINLVPIASCTTR
jgi:hypothetical protein